MIELYAGDNIDSQQDSTQKRVCFSNDVTQYVFLDNYDRKVPKSKWSRKTEKEKHSTLLRLNEYKRSEMAVHIDSLKYLHFYTSVPD